MILFRIESLKASSFHAAPEAESRFRKGINGLCRIEMLLTNSNFALTVQLANQLGAGFFI